MRVEGIVADILSSKANTMDYRDGYVTSNMLCDIDKEAGSEIGWVHRHNLVGRSKFSRDANQKLFIEYAVHIMEQ